MRIQVDEALCTGQGRCYLEAPEVFSADHEGYCAQKGTTFEVDESLEERARLGADSCPQAAITVLET